MGEGVLLVGYSWVGVAAAVGGSGEWVGVGEYLEWGK